MARRFPPHHLIGRNTSTANLIYKIKNTIPHEATIKELFLSPPPPPPHFPPTLQSEWVTNQSRSYHSDILKAFIKLTNTILKNPIIGAKTKLEKF